ncbi:MAG: glycerol kinase, partial [Clostridia bacterium]|nr:glycerol kinase [Clostridia bacterium]
MANQYVMALDQGTTSSRAIVFDKHGNIIAKSQREFEQHYPQAGWVEHNPMDILYSEYQSISTILSEGAVTAEDIACIGVTNQRETTILWDKTTGLPIYNAPVWQCRRTAAMCEDLKARGLEKYVRDHTGLL